MKVAADLPGLHNKLLRRGSGSASGGHMRRDTRLTCLQRLCQKMCAVVDGGGSRLVASHHVLQTAVHPQPTPCAGTFAEQQACHGGLLKTTGFAALWFPLPLAASCQFTLRRFMRSSYETAAQASCKRVSSRRYLLIDRQTKTKTQTRKK